MNSPLFISPATYKKREEKRLLAEREPQVPLPPLSPGEVPGATVSPPTQPLPRPAQPTGGKKRKRASDDVPDCKAPKPLLSGCIPVEQFVQTLEKVSTARLARASFRLGVASCFRELLLPT